MSQDVTVCHSMSQESRNPEALSRTGDAAGYVRGVAQSNYPSIARSFPPATWASWAMAQLHSPYPSSPPPDYTAATCTLVQGTGGADRPTSLHDRTGRVPHATVYVFDGLASPPRTVDHTY